MIETPTPTAGHQPPRRMPSNLLEKHVVRTVLSIQNGYLAAGGSTSQSVRKLALLRRTLGSAGGADPRSWSIVLDGFPDEILGPQRGPLTEPTRAESAAMVALTTYAVHQQSQRQPMHQQGINLGEATRRLAVQRARQDAPAGMDDATIQRMHRVSMAHTWQMRSQALRALVTLLRSAERPVPLDYGRIATDLYWLADPAHATHVHLAWARGLYTTGQPRRENSTETTAADQHTNKQTGDQA